MTLIEHQNQLLNHHLLMPQLVGTGDASLSELLPAITIQVNIERCGSLSRWQSNAYDSTQTALLAPRSEYSDKMYGVLFIRIGNSARSLS